MIADAAAAIIMIGHFRHYLRLLRRHADYFIFAFSFAVFIYFHYCGL